MKKKGGTMTVMSGRWSGRKREINSDSKGRWSSVTLQGKKGRLVTIITAYRVCQQKGGEGCTIYHQQQMDFEVEGKRMVNLRKQFCTDMTRYVQKLHENNHVVILMGDFNEECDKAGNQIDNMLRDSGLINVMSLSKGENFTMPNTYDRGTKCIDMIAISDTNDIPKHSIVKAGFMPFYFEFCSDHRAVYCDIKTSILFGKINKDNVNPSNRPFTTNNIQQCERFKTTVRKLYNKSKIFEKVRHLRHRFKNDDPIALKKTIEECQQLGTTAGQLLIHAGKKIGKKKYKHGKPYSNELDQIARRFRKEKNKLRYMRQRRQGYMSTKDEEKMIQTIKSTYKELRRIQKQAKEIRENFLMEIAEKRANEWHLTKAAALNVILQSESSKRTFARHGAVMKGGEKGSIKSLMVPIPEYRSSLEETKAVEWTEIEDNSSIYSLLLKKNAQQLMRSAHSPFAYGKIVDGCGTEGDGPLTNKILENSLTNQERYDLINEHADVRDELDTFITALARPKDNNGNIINDFEWKYGIEEYRKTFRRTRECTACGPSGLNMSFWKAIAEDDDLAEVQAFLIEKAFQFGFTYTRWKTSWHCMLKKDSAPYLHRLRIIQLFEGDFNGALKYLLGRLLMYHIVNTNQCDTQAFGSIPGKTAHDALITLQLTYDHSRVKKMPIASLFNDAAGCYDRIRSLLSYLCMVRVGCPSGIAYCHSLTQREMVHHVKTSAGPSTDNIKWGPFQETIITEENGVKSIRGNIGGIGQGGGASPVGWLAVLLVMIQTYSKYTSGITLSDPMGLYSLALFIISYVDDNTLVQSFNQTQTMPSILSQLQFCLTRWHNILKITGGDLALEKCTFCILKWKWRGAFATLETIHTSPGILRVDNTEIKRLEPNRGTRVLGVRMAMNGSFQDELIYRRQQSRTMANKLYCSWLSHLDAFMVYKTRFGPAAEYPLLVTTFSKQEIESIQKPFIHLLLPKIGLNRHTPLAVVHGPMFRGGLGLTTLEEVQVTKHFNSFQSHIRRDDDIGKGLKLQTMVQQLEIGCGRLFFNTDPVVYSYGTKNTRLGYLWKQCYRYSITVSMQQEWHPSGCNDERPTVMDFIVQLFPKSKPKRDIQLRRINACRLYLKILWVDDLLIDPLDTAIDVDIVNGHKINTRSSLDFPFQARPSKADFVLWKDSVHRSLCVYRTNPHTQRAVVRSRLPPPGPILPSSSIHSDYHDILKAISGHDSLSQKFDHLPIQFKDIVGNLHLPDDDGQSFLTSLKHGNAALASDGSFMEHLYKGTHAYILVSKDTDFGQIKGSATCPHSDHMSSAPAEHYGAIAVIVILIVLLYHYEEDGLGWPAVTLYIDNEEVVNRGQNRNPKFRNVKQYMVHDYDLWMVTNCLLGSIQLKVNFEWVRGHQELDDQNENIAAILLNTEVDKLATKQYEKQEPPKHRGAFHSGIVCYHQKGFHVQRIRNAISARESDDSLIQYYLDHGWTMQLISLVDWINMESFLKTRHPIDRCNIIQSMHDWQHTGSQKSKFMPRRCSDEHGDNHKSEGQYGEYEGECPFECGHTESPFHYMQCTGDILSTARKIGKEALEQSLTKMHTAPSLQEAILQGIFCWEDSTEYELDETSHKYLFDEAHTRLLTSQRDIGWDKFIKGYLSKDWGYIQEQYYRHTKSINHRKFTRNNWVVQLLRSLHTYRHSIWMTRNKSLHGGGNKDQKEFNRKKILKIVSKLYQKDRSSLPIRERSLFNLPLKLRKKQGNQQLQLWIQRAKLLFDTYKEIPIRSDQQSSITKWLKAWTTKGIETPSISAATTQPENTDAEMLYQSDNDIDDHDVRNTFSQMNLTNWLKSYGHHDNDIDSNSEIRHTQTPRGTNQTKNSNQSIRDELPIGQPS
jgi:hypothetical protein